MLAELAPEPVGDSLNICMAKRTGSADLPLHGGRVPAWLSSHGQARPSARRGDRLSLWKEGIPQTPLPPILVSVARLRDGDGLAFVRHHHQRPGGAQARPCATRAGVGDPCLWRPRKALAAYAGGVAGAC